MEKIPRPPLHQSKGTQTIPEATQKNQHEMFTKVVDLKEKNYSDQTGKFPYLSIKGMSYIMIEYHTNEN